MPIRQRRSEQQGGRATLGNTGVRRRQRASSLQAALQAATVAAVVAAVEEAEAAEASETAAEPESPATEPVEVAEGPRRWHIVRQEILDKKPYEINAEACNDDFRAGCAKCDKKLPVAIVDVRDELSSQLHAMVLACGHIFCHGCLDRIWGNDRKEQRKLACPVCETEMQCRHCGKTARVVAIPKFFYNAESPKSVPPTLPEGASWPSDCVRCRASMEWTDSQGERAVMEMWRAFGEECVATPTEVAFRRLFNDFMDDLDRDNNVVAPADSEATERLVTLFTRCCQWLPAMRKTFIGERQHQRAETDLWL